jgi:hypothetical protein
MTTRVFGPVRAAGTQITELEGDKPVEPGALGWVGYAGLLEKGPTGELIVLSTPDVAKRRIGSYISDGYCPDAIYDYFNLAAGAGGVLAVRVTDGNEVQAQYNLYARVGSALTAVGNLKAHNGGRWGGKRKKYTGVLSVITDVTNTQLTTGDATSFETDEYVGGYIQLEGVGATQYPITGNTAAGVFTVASDQTMRDDLDAGTPTDLEYYIVRENESKALSVEIRNGEDDPDNEFGLFIYVDGVLVNQYPNLSMDPTSARFWENVINNDDANYEVVAEDTWTGAITASVRPANHYGVSDTGGVAETVLTCVIMDYVQVVAGSVTGGVTLGTTTDAMLSDRIVITMTSATAGDVVSDRFGAIGSITTDTEFNPPAGTGGCTDKNKWGFPFTVVADAGYAADDTITINYKPFLADELINGTLYPDQTNAADKRTGFRIVDNDHNTITVAPGSDMTAVATAGDEFMVVAPREFEGGRDGNADIADANYNQQAWDTSDSPFNQVRDKGYGLVKLATPGVYSTSVQQNGVNYAYSKNHQYRVEIDPSVTTDDGADAYINDTIGRNNYEVVAFPSYGYVADPEGNGEGRLKLIPLTGMIHGREARMAVDNDGYHRAAAGVNAVLPGVLKLTTGERVINEELLNPRGINVIKKKQGNFVIWGDRVPASDSTWRWKHQRETMSYYEQVLIENFDWIIFQLNNTETQQRALASLRAFFIPEFNKGALDGDEFEDAASIKIDNENNTVLTKEAGDLFADVRLRLVGTVERFRIRMSKLGIFESVG